MPGISAGTLALIMGIYEKIIFSITTLIPFSRKNNNNLIFLLCLTIGILLAIFFLTKGMTLLLSLFPLQLYSFFTGLIVASLPRLFKLTDKKRKSFLLIILIAIGFFISLKITPGLLHFQDSSFLFFISGFFGAFSSILPGLSGSTVLLILGVYHSILKALTEWMIGYLLIFAMGGALGLGCALYFIRSFLEKKKNLFFCLILGLIIGSLPKVIPWKQTQFESTATAIAHIISFICVGIIAFLLIEKGFSFNNKDKNSGSHTKQL